MHESCWTTFILTQRDIRRVWRIIDAQLYSLVQSIMIQSNNDCEIPIGHVCIILDTLSSGYVTRSVCMWCAAYADHTSFYQTELRNLNWPRLPRPITKYQFITYINSHFLTFLISEYPTETKSQKDKLRFRHQHQVTSFIICHQYNKRTKQRLELYESSRILGQATSQTTPIRPLYPNQLSCTHSQDDFAILAYGYLVIP